MHDRNQARHRRSVLAYSWPMKSHALRELETHLRERDEVSLTRRAERLAQLMLLGEPTNGRMLFGGTDCVNALWEAQWSFINGLDLCTILAAQTCVEKLLAGFIDLDGGGDSPEGSYARLLKDATERRLISLREYQLFDRLRRTRNPYAHYRSVNDGQNIQRRAMNTGEHPDALLQSDAQAAVYALIDLVNRPPFAVGPVTVRLSEQDLLPPVHPGQLSLLHPPN